MLQPAPPSDSIRDFVASMPRGYRHRFSERGIGDHAALALGRQGATARVGCFHSRRGLSAAALCIVADDRPGLLAIISAALVMEALDVVHAEAYTRHRIGENWEAVDVFWVRDLHGVHAEELTDARLRSLEETLTRLLLGETAVADVQAVGHHRAPAPYEANVRFVETGDGALSTLEVETVDRTGLLLALAQALFEQKVQIVRSEVHTTHEKVRDRFEIQELDGRPIGADRRLAIQVAVLAAIDPARAS
ncbi:MAG: hypothetical protein JW751_05970 [Polyangiaceae bacterium]|nr:hypothetical protein [Polyangiaceae bacterium]